MRLGKINKIMKYDDIKQIFEKDIRELKFNTAFFEKNEYVLNLGNGKLYEYNVLYLMDDKLCDFTDKNNNCNIKYSMFVCGKDYITEEFNKIFIVVGQNPSYSSKLILIEPIKAFSRL